MDISIAIFLLLTIALLEVIGQLIYDCIQQYMMPTLRTWKLQAPCFLVVVPLGLIIALAVWVRRYSHENISIVFTHLWVWAIESSSLFLVSLSSTQKEKLRLISTDTRSHNRTEKRIDIRSQSLESHGLY